jgi:hypothetical protein
MTASNPLAPSAAPLGLLAAADLQDHLLTASNDLDRLQRLLAEASDTLLAGYFGARAAIELLRADREDALPQQAMRQLVQAITALQFQDMASQLIVHTQQRLRNCADRLAADAFDGDDADGAAFVAQAPLRPNPVTQDEMDAGAVDLF